MNKLEYRFAYTKSEFRMGLRKERNTRNIFHLQWVGGHSGSAALVVVL